MSTIATITVSIAPAATAFFRSAKERLAGIAPPLCHARLYAGHPRLCVRRQTKDVMAGTSPAMTIINLYAFHEYTERISLVIAKRRTFDKSGVTVERKCLGIVNTCLKPQQRQSRITRDRFKLRQHPPSDPATAPVRTHIHALDLAPAARIALERAAADHVIAIAHDQKRHRRIGQRRSIQQVIALGRIER